MQPAAEVFKHELDNYKLTRGLINVHSNFNARPFMYISDTKRKLAKEIYSPVKWEQILHTIYERDFFHEFPSTYECGPGKQLGAMLRQTNLSAFKQYKNVFD